MAARNRPRNGAIKDERDDAREERSMWESIIKDLEKVREVNAKVKATSASIVEKEEKMGKSKYTSLCATRDLELYAALATACMSSPYIATISPCPNHVYTANVYTQFVVRHNSPSLFISQERNCSVTP